VENTGQPEPFPRCLCNDTNSIDTSFADLKEPVAFPRCTWAIDLSKRPFPGRPPTSAQAGTDPHRDLGEWLWESGFDKDPINDMEWIRDLNLRAMYGAWDALKNVERRYPNHKLAWAAYIAGKRESRRLLGDVILAADDFRTNKTFVDASFPCSWHIDLHSPHPAFQKGHEGNEFIATYTRGEGYSYRNPYWAPYRCLYSRNIENLFMAGRDISVTHEALGAVRVMRTCGMMGEVVGMAAAVCKAHECEPRQVYESHLEQLKVLMTRGAGKPAIKP
jgi:FAD-dependent oxidoreductase family protein